ncbi:guanine nucleotide-binding protein subunit alpha [Balamuthia mandrillaris]
MGDCFSKMTPDEKLARRKNQEIEQELAHDRKRYREDVKLLLLGTGESGKSTVFKQMKIISEGGFKQDELKSYTSNVYSNCITQMKVIVNAASVMNIDMEHPENKTRATRLMQLPATCDSWSEQVGDDIAELWQDAGIRATYEKRDTYYQLNDSAAYFFDQIERINNPDYIPSEQDVLRVRIRSTGIEEAVFQFDDISFKMLDVGGQRSERRKWIHCFDGVTAIVFCVGISEYDQTLREECNKNRMHESLDLFDDICNSPWFENTAFILFLNKIDLFKEKIKKSDLRNTFENYTGGADYDAACAFIKAQFLERNTSPHVIFPHFTCAVDTKNIEFVFKCVRKTLLEKIVVTLF